MRKWKRSCAALLTAAVFLGTFIWTSPRPAFAADTSIYVSPSGNDSTGNGSIGSPYKTVTKARDVVRSLISGGMSGNVTVYLRGGEYVLTSQIVLNSQDSGRNGYQVIYKAYPGETPVLNIGKYVNGWQQVSGKPYYKTTVTEFGKSDSFIQQTMYENNERAIKARFPNPQPNGRNNYLFAEANGSPAPNTSLKFKSSDNLPAVSDVSQMDMYVWPGGTHPWEAKYRTISSINYSTRVIAINGTTDNYNLETGSMYYLEGALEFLDSPGEFFYDKPASTLYYYPRNTANLNKIFVPLREDWNDSIIRFNGGPSHITIEGLTFRNTGFDSSEDHQGFTSAITLENGNDITIRGNDFYSLGSTAVGFGGFQSTFNRIKIENNRMRDLGRGAVQVDRFSQDTVNDLTIRNNYLYKGGRLKGDECAFSSWSAVNRLNFSNNRVDEWPRFATYFKGSVKDSVVSFNDISNSMHDTEDGAMIYAFFTTESNTEIKNNLIHDNNLNYSYGGSLIYMDDGAGGYRIYNNVLYDNQKTGSGHMSPIVLKGVANQFENNIVANNNANKEFGLISTFAMSGADNKNIRTDRNIFYNNNTNFFHFMGNWEDARYASSDYNLIYNPNNSTTLTWTKNGTTTTHDYGAYAVHGFNLPGQNWDGYHDWGYYTWTQWKALLNGKFDNHSLNQDPLFINAAANDFRLRHDSPAYGLGFQDINIRDMGLDAGFPFANAEETLATIHVWKSGDTVDKGNINLTAGQTAQLQLLGRTATGYVANLSNASVSYSSSNTAAAAVSASGLITAAGTGTAKITVSVTKAGVTKTKDMYVIVGGSSGSANIALNKPVQATANCAGGEGPEKAVDGTTANNSKWCSGAAGDKWLRVDLGQAASVERWVVKHAGAGGESAGWNTANFKLQRSTDGTSWTDVDTVTGNTANVTDRTITSVSSRYFRLYITNAGGDGVARIYEFELYGPALNVALNKTANGTTSCAAGEGPSKAVDGTTANNSKWCSGAAGDKWLSVDLGQSYSIARWVVKHAGAGGESASWNTAGFKLQKSSDGTNWTDVDTVTGNTANVTDRSVAAFQSRYVRLYITNAGGDNVARIYEFEVYGS